MPPNISNTGEGKTRLRTKLDDLALLLNQFASEFLNLESEKRILLLEGDMINKIHGLTSELESIESLDGKEGDVFASFLKDLTDVVREVGTMSLWKRENHTLEVFLRILSIIRNLEEQLREFLPIVLTIDKNIREGKYETFGGLFQKLMDTLEEKKHMILGNVDEKITIAQ